MICAVLDINGKRCRRHARHAVQYHGDGELYSFKEPSVTWVLVPMCQDHAEAAMYKVKAPQPRPR